MRQDVRKSILQARYGDNQVTLGCIQCMKNIDAFLLPCSIISYIGRCRKSGRAYSALLYVGVLGCVMAFASTPWWKSFGVISGNWSFVFPCFEPTVVQIAAHADGQWCEQIQLKSIIPCDILRAQPPVTMVV